MDSSNEHEGEAKSPLSALDLSRISFPSDGLTIGVLRRAYPKEFDVGFGEGDDLQPRFFLQGGQADQAMDTVGGLLYWERWIASHVYAVAVGCPVPDVGMGMDYKAMKTELAALYIKYGVAAGKHEARESIRQFEQQAIALANEGQPRRP